MAKVVALIASALCILALAGVAQSQQDEFVVKGQVYCDTCRVLFQTKLSKNVAGTYSSSSYPTRNLNEH